MEIPDKPSSAHRRKVGRTFVIVSVITVLGFIGTAYPQATPPNGQKAARSSTASAKATRTKAAIFSGTCGTGSFTTPNTNYGIFSESNGVRAWPPTEENKLGYQGGQGNPLILLPAEKKAKRLGLVLDEDGFMWKVRRLFCSKLSIVQTEDHPRLMKIVFLTNKNKVLFVFGGRLLSVVRGEAMFLVQAAKLPDGRIVPTTSDNGYGCSFYFPGLYGPGSPGQNYAFAQGWETHFRMVDCTMNVKTKDGHLISADMRFDVHQTSGFPKLREGVLPPPKSADKPSSAP